jgi:putative ABC transport system permease protein
MTWIDEDSGLQIDIIQSADLLAPVVICGLVVFALLLGLVAGIGPAWHISKALPIDIVKGTPQTGNYRGWRTSGQALSIVFQHVITMVLLAVALTMMLQMRHLINAPLGYNHERLMEVRALQFGDPRMTLLLDEVRKLPCVEDAALGLGSPLHAGSNNTYEIDGRTIAWQQFRETESWMRMLDLKIITDYGTTGPNGVKTYVTPNALALHGLPAEARAFRFSKNSELTQIDGLIEPVHLHNILETTYEGRPQMVQLYKEPLIKYCLMMRYQGDKDEAKRQVGEVYRKVFERDMENNFNFYDDQLRSCYDKEHRILSLVEVFTVVAFLIAMLGLLAMSTYYLQQHRMEIAVRKAFGGTSSEVLCRLLSRFMAYVVVAFIIAIPTIYYIGNDWLSNFSYRIVLSPWIFAAAGSACFIISLLTVIIQSWRAASENPINNIKTE